MVGKPKLENRKEQPYLGIRTQVKMKELGAVLPKIHNDLADWMEAKQIQPSGAPFFRYLVIDAENGFQVEVGIPVESFVAGEGQVRALTLPAGCYATLLHTGHFSGLHEAVKFLLEWAERNEITWHKADFETGEVWEARLETYLNVGLEKDPEKWQTELAFLTLEN
ncbi:MAG TPA: GyrI-like domain-containing protein [Candidatus Omnitrophica bacterium]|nr:GyrI-like domain-containing protein [Candidatus Omnitrophota bacterium]